MLGANKWSNHDADLWENKSFRRNGSKALSGKEEIICDYEGDGLTIALNYIYLLDPLKVIEEENPYLVMIEIGGTVGDIENELYIHRY